MHHENSPQIDPTLTRADRLVGQVLGQVGALPDVYTELEINFYLLRRLLGVRTMVSGNTQTGWVCAEYEYYIHALQSAESVMRAALCCGPVSWQALLLGLAVWTSSWKSWLH